MICLVDRTTVFQIQRLLLLHYLPVVVVSLVASAIIPTCTRPALLKSITILPGNHANEYWQQHQSSLFLQSDLPALMVPRSSTTCLSARPAGSGKRRGAGGALYMTAASGGGGRSKRGRRGLADLQELLQLGDDDEEKIQNNALDTRGTLLRRSTTTTTDNKAMVSTATSTSNNSKISVDLMAWAGVQEEGQQETIATTITSGSSSTSGSSDIMNDTNSGNRNSQQKKNDKPVMSSSLSSQSTTTSSSTGRGRIKKALLGRGGELETTTAAVLQQQQQNRNNDRTTKQMEDMVQEFLTVLDGKDSTSSNQNVNNKNKKKQEDRVSQLLNLLEQVLEIRQQQQQQQGVTSLSLLTSWKQLTSVRAAGSSSSSPKHVYRLAWVGSEDMISYVGTGLHKVPLARLDEVFLTLGGPKGIMESTTINDTSNRKMKNSKKTTASTMSSLSSRSSNSGMEKTGRIPIEWMEIIRILGPFPNVKNTLQGYCTVSSINNSNQLLRLQIQWDSLVDGIGKQRMGSEGRENRGDDVKVVELHLLLCEPSILLMTGTTKTTEKGAPVPSSSSSSLSPDYESILTNQGQRVLVFVRETELEKKLDAGRVIEKK